MTHVHSAALTERIGEARQASERSALLAQDAERRLSTHGAEATQSEALVSIALSLSAIATVILATLDDETSR